MGWPGGSILHTTLVAMGLQLPRTQTTAAERLALAHYATDMLRAVEIGVFEGLTTRLIAEHLRPDGVLFAIDPFIPGRLGICWGQVTAKIHISRSSCREKLTFVKKWSYEAVRQISGNFDFIFIDGDHSLEAIRRDWEDWSPRISAGGIVALHDTRVPDYNLGVARYGSYQYYESTIKFDRRFETIHQVDSLSVLRRH